MFELAEQPPTAEDRREPVDPGLEASGPADAVAGGVSGSGPGVAGSGLVSGLAGVADGLARVEVRGLGDDELCATLLATLRAQRQLDAAMAHLAGELDCRGVTDAVAGLRTGSWLSSRAGIAPSGAARLVRDGRALRQLPNIDAAFTGGRISADHARVLIRAANPRVRAGIDAAAEHLIGDIGSWRFDVWARQVAAFADELDQDGGHNPAGDTPEDRVHIRRVGDALKGDLLLHGDAAAIFEQALERFMAEQLRQARNDAEHSADLPVPAGPTLRARALTELARHALADNPTDTRPSPPDATIIVRLPPGTRPTDRYGPTSPFGPTGPDGPDGPTGFYGMITTTPDGHRLPDDLAAMLRCDATLSLLLTDTNGLPLFVGRALRLATPAQRRALTARDGGCAFPGCSAPPSWCDAHHLVAWEHGGRTDLDNLVLVCRHHHRVLHRNGWTATLDTHHHLHITTPHGDTLTGQRHGHTPNAPPRTP